MDSSLQIKTVTSEIKNAPLSHPFTTARHTVTEMQSVQVTVELSDGSVGHGAATPNEVVTGDTLETTNYVINQTLAPVINGRSFEDWESLLNCLDGAITHNEPAKAAVEIALYDLRSRLFNVPLVQLLGSSNRTITTDFTLGIDEIDQMIASAEEKVAQGFTSLKIKIGTGDLQTDLNRVAQISSAVGPNIRLRLDANQAWTAKEAITGIKELEKLGLPIDFIEQPVKATDIVGLKQVTQSSPIPIMADEIVFNLQDAISLTTQHACDYINIKLMKTGGIHMAEKINAVCEAQGVNCMLGCMIESQVSLAAAVAFVASHENVKFADLDAVYMSQEKLTPQHFKLDGNRITLNDEIGL